jgi:hypothetical protein
MCCHRKPFPSFIIQSTQKVQTVTNTRPLHMTKGVIVGSVTQSHTFKPLRCSAGTSYRSSLNSLPGTESFFRRRECLRYSRTSSPFIKPSRSLPCSQKRVSIQCFVTNQPKDISNIIQECKNDFLMFSLW